MGKTKVYNWFSTYLDLMGQNSFLTTDLELRRLHLDFDVHEVQSIENDSGKI